MCTVKRLELRLGERLQAGVARALGRLPRSSMRRLVGPPVSVDGQVLDVEAQLALLMLERANRPPYETLSLSEARAEVLRQARVATGRRVRVQGVEELELPGPGGPLHARLYIPGAPGGGAGLLVYFHGGGWTVGGLDTHDNTCRFLAREAGARVLSVAYRLAPEHPFPAAVDDALAAFRFAVRHHAELDTRPDAIAVGGDSAGGNLAAVVAQLAARDGGPAPAFQLLYFPVVDLSRKRASYGLFGDGFYLTQRQIDWYLEQYLPDPDRALDPRASPLLAEDLAGLPPAYIGVAGFDPLRDEGEEYARRLRDAGVTVTFRCHRGLPHAFVNVVGIGRAGRDATREGALVMRAALSSPTDVVRRAGAPAARAGGG
jgi:acetyl esterase